jgi:hypothetical protein
MLRVGSSGEQCLFVGHTFARPQKAVISVPLPSGSWRVAGEMMPSSGGVHLAGGKIHWTPGGHWSAGVALLVSGRTRKQKAR